MQLLQMSGLCQMLFYHLCSVICSHCHLRHYFPHVFNPVIVAVKHVKDDIFEAVPLVFLISFSGGGGDVIESSYVFLFDAVFLFYIWLNLPVNTA